MNGKTAPIIFWFRRDLRLSDHPGFAEAARSGRPVIPVFIRDELVDGLGAAPKWRLGQGLESLAADLERRGSKLIFRSGDALQALRALVAETGADTVCWTRAYDPDSIRRDSAIKAALRGQGIEARSHSGHLLFEPWTVANRSGLPYKVFSPFWRAVRGREVAAPEAAPSRLAAPDVLPASEDLGSWALGRALRRGAEVVRTFVRPGEAVAHEKLENFIHEKLPRYPELRDRPDVDGTSGLSEYMALGEIGPRTVWHTVMRALQSGVPGAEAFLRQLAWREFSYHLMFHSPVLLTGNWKPEWDGFPWSEDSGQPHVVAWKRARTGVPIVDAGLREMYVTGRMHNRVRMLAASYLTKHLMTHWKIGMDWFADCLIDWDPAANAMGWQWVAGSGPDAAPYFRVFNPATQAERFDPDGSYRRRWVAETQAKPPKTAEAYFRAVPRRWGLSPRSEYPDPIVRLDDGRRAALAAYQAGKSRVRN
ncbi:deoxyribodipyrimidine photolyase [Ruegeria marisrubri]|uniref:Deoxyribodipyrimidine photolyase n=1 Tax=Ruegeria marisrubri TaxID=1685379 RepID=A0A0X3U0V1_9RHOB|nr:deoxyribodipyrimidine photo-lyase [Ruegeria marisrubri]KUJ80891.1 deoxyribodipyrimidine photolyase [Ruegeria marisrubri]